MQLREEMKIFGSGEADTVSVSDGGQDCLQRANTVASVVNRNAQVNDSRWKWILCTLDCYLLQTLSLTLSWSC